jgi:ABC-type sugar transport system permease subunit
MLEKELYEKQRSKQYDIKRLYRFSFILTMVASIVASIISFQFILKDKSDTIISEFTYVNIVFYLLGILTALIPSIYYVLKQKRNADGK